MVENSIRLLKIETAVDDLSLAQQVVCDEVVLMVSKRYYTTFSKVKSSSRRREDALPRQVSMYLLYNVLNFTSTYIGKYFKRDHSTVLSSIQTVYDLMDTNEDEQRKILTLEKRLKLLL